VVTGAGSGTKYGTTAGTTSMSVPPALRAAAAIASFCLLVYGVLVLGWPVLSVMVLFWLENVLIGAFNVLKMLATGLRRALRGVQHDRLPALAAALFSSAFFTVHYGLFCFVHGGIVLTLFSDIEGVEASAVFDMVAIAAARDRGLLLALIAMLAMQLVEFADWLRGPAPERADALMAAPYGRVVILHVALIVGALLIQAFKSPTAGLLLLLALKLAFDLAPILRAPPARDTAARPANVH
jgi:hypothetical protein